MGAFSRLSLPARQRALRWLGIFALLMAGFGNRIFGACSRRPAWNDLKRARCAAFVEFFVIAWLYLCHRGVRYLGVLWGRVLGDIDQRWLTARSRPLRRIASRGCSKYVPGQLGALVYKISPGAGNAGISTASVTLSFVYEKHIPADRLVRAGGVDPVGAMQVWRWKPRAMSDICCFVAGAERVLAILLAAVLLGPALRSVFCAPSEAPRHKWRAAAALLGALQRACEHGLWFIVPRLLNGGRSSSPDRWHGRACWRRGDLGRAGRESYVVAGAIGILCAVFRAERPCVREGVIVGARQPGDRRECRGFLPQFLARLIATAADGLWWRWWLRLRVWQRQGARSLLLATRTQQ